MSAAAIQLAKLKTCIELVINDAKLNFLLGWVVPFLPRCSVLKTARNFGEKI
jgi:hypothetical protein